MLIIACTSVSLSPRKHKSISCKKKIIFIDLSMIWYADIIHVLTCDGHYMMGATGYLCCFLFQHRLNNLRLEREREREREREIVEIM